MAKKAVVLVSGGLDSVTLAYYLKQKGYEDLTLISFNYNQRHKRELAYAGMIAAELGARHVVVDLRSVGSALAGSALTDKSVDVPEGHYAADNMKLTVVPNRNAMMLAIAFSIAAAEGAEVVGTAVHAGDHAVYSDCRPEFTEAFQRMEQLALEGLWKVDLVTPFVDWTKAEIAREAGDLGVPIEKTWSCYKGEDVHCGRCGTCVERAEAIYLAGIEDPTVYVDPDYWKVQVRIAELKEEVLEGPNAPGVL